MISGKVSNGRFGSRGGRLITSCRKVVILEPTKMDALTLIGIAAIIFALTFGYYNSSSSWPHDKQADLIRKRLQTNQRG